MALRKETPPRTIPGPTRSSVIGIVVAGFATGSVAWLPVAWWCEAPAGNDSLGKVTVQVESSDQGQLRHSKRRTQLARTSSELPIPEGRSLIFGREAQALPPEQLGQHLPPIARPGAVESLDSEPRLLPADGGENSAPQTDVRVAEEGALQDRAVRPARLVIHAPLTVSVTPPATAQTSVPSNGNGEGETIRLMHDLQSEDSATVEATEQALLNRGFTADHLKLARKLTSPDPEQRAQLAAKLPGVPGIDPRLWLTWLLRDDHAQVRASALAVLATTGDPETLRRVLEIARQDRDPLVRAQLSNIDKLLRAER